MAEHLERTTATGGSRTTDAILAVLAAEEPHGATADQVAHAIGLGVTVEPVQDELEKMVRRGSGVGAIYTRAVGV